MRTRLFITSTTAAKLDLIFAESDTAIVAGWIRRQTLDDKVSYGVGPNQPRRIFKMCFVILLYLFVCDTYFQGVLLKKSAHIIPIIV